MSDIVHNLCLQFQYRLFIPTVTSAVVATDNVAVKDDPAFSAILVAEVDNVTVGALSFSVMVMVTDCVPSSVADPPETVDMATIPVSFPS